MERNDYVKHIEAKYNLVLSGPLDKRVCYDFSPPPGWYGLVDNLIGSLLASGWDGQLFQVKQKFGGLRFYVGKASGEVHMLIEQARADSWSICEVCGDTARLEDSFPFVRTLCKRHSILHAMINLEVNRNNSDFGNKETEEFKAWYDRLEKRWN